jgi:multiple antibiotic resistance protein
VGRTTLIVFNSFLIAFSALLPLINPVGSALVFNGLVGVAPGHVYEHLARRIAINNVIFLAIIELLGVTILNFFGISLPIVQFSGGIVIAAMGWSVLNERDARATSRKKQEETDAADAQAHDFEQEAFYPFTFPITSGPGTLVALLTVTAHNSGRTLTRHVLSHIGVFLAIVVLSLLVYICYRYAPKITRAIPASTAHGILRVIAFILFCIGVQISWNGLAELIREILHA